MRNLIFGVVSATFCLNVYSQQTATIVLSGATLLTGSSETVEVYDMNCNRTVGQFTVSGPDGQTTVGPVCVNDSGYINIKRRKLPNTIWHQNSLMKPGESFNPS